MAQRVADFASRLRVEWPRAQLIPPSSATPVRAAVSSPHSALLSGYPARCYIVELSRSPGEEPGGSANLNVKKRELHKRATGLDHPVLVILQQAITAHWR
jgi:hypothetical protein